jgi:hypothetical protein
MYCLTCNEFAQLKVVAERIGLKAPGLEENINAFLLCHLVLMHNLSYRDLHAAADLPPSVDQRYSG